jgi:hypothetical protein
MTAAIAATVTTVPCPSVSAARPAPAGGVACMVVRSSANSRPWDCGGTMRIRRLCAHAVMGAAHIPTAASAATVTIVEPIISSAARRAATICAVMIDAGSGARHVTRLRTSAASSSPPVVAATR